MKRSKWLRLLAVLFSFAIVASACGGSDSGETSTSGESGSGSETGGAEEEEDVKGGVSEEDAQDAFKETTTTEAAMEDDEGSMEEEDDSAMAEASSIEDLEKEWAATRQIVIDELTAGIEAGDIGLGDDGILRGAGGFEIDTNACPGDWSNTDGITADSIRIGHTTAKSGNLAAYGNIADGMDAYFQYVNENGGIDGKNIELIVKDDAYVAAQTIEFVNELIEAENVFQIVTLGSPNTMATYDKINENCFPQPFVMTGHPAWGDPVNHPWTTGLQLSYATEGILWGEWIRANLADDIPVKVAGLVMDNDFGLAYEGAMETFAEKNPDVVSEFVPIRHDPAAPTLTNEVTSISAAEPDVFISMTAGNPCLLAIQEAEAVGLLETVKAAFTPSVCKGIEAYMKPAGDAADGWYIVGGGVKATTDPLYVDEVYIKWLNEELTNRGLDNSVDLYGTGFGQYGFPQVEALRIAAALPGGLSRTNMILAVRHIDIVHPILLEGMTFSADGNNDSYFIEGTDISVFDAGSQSWIQEGATIDLNGSSPNCAWDKDNGGCK